MVAEHKIPQVDAGSEPADLQRGVARSWLHGHIAECHAVEGRYVDLSDGHFRTQQRRELLFGYRRDAALYRIKRQPDVKYGGQQHRQDDDGDG